MKYLNRNLDYQSLREEIYNDFIQIYDYMSYDQINELVDEEMKTYIKQ